MTQADIAIVGAGCAGYSLLSRLLQSKKLKSKRIVLIDSHAESSKHKTWCFWQQRTGHYQHLVRKSWPRIHVSRHHEVIAPATWGYTYNMISSEDFMAYHQQLVAQYPNVEMVQGSVESIDSASGIINTSRISIAAEHIFSSVLFSKPLLARHDINLLQHFRGWFIKTRDSLFNTDVAELMNFSTSQQHGLAFFYVLPTSTTEALIEYTLFSEQTLAGSEYDAALQVFCEQRFGADGWEITRQEDGVIPMTTQHFPSSTGRLTYIGTAGGQTKASTGYTFQFIQKHSDYILRQLELHNRVEPMPTPRRFHFYDAVLLSVLRDRSYPADIMFMNLFRRNPLPRLFRFLNNESTIAEEIKLMNTTPWKHFLPAAFKQLRHL